VDFSSYRSQRIAKTSPRKDNSAVGISDLEEPFNPDEGKEIVLETKFISQQRENEPGTTFIAV